VPGLEPLVFRAMRASNVGTLVVLVGILAGTAVADAAPLTADKMSTPKIVRVGGTAQVRTCAYTGAAPGALPASCGGKSPTAAECVAGTTQCAKDTKTSNHCAKAFVEAYCATTAPEEQVTYPGGKPLKNTIHAWQSAQTGLHIPPGSNGPGKQVPFTGFTKSGGNRPLPKATTGTTALSQVGGVAPMRVITQGNGTYNASTTGQWIAKQDTVRSNLFAIHQGLARQTPNQVLDVQMNNVLGGISLESIWVGDGSDSPANRAVNSCNEFAYQRWYDYTRFKNAAKALNRNYRGIYNLATDPQSPIYLEKAKLKQFGFSGQADLPLDWAAGRIPRNIFFTKPPDAVSGAIKARIDKYISPSTKKYFEPAAGSSRFGLHKTLRAQLESRYALSDDEMDERTARQERYLELVSSRDSIAAALLCARFPEGCCGTPLTNTPNGLHDLLLKVQGWAVINPDPTKFGEYGADVGPTDWYDSWTGAQQVHITSVVRDMAGRNAVNPGARVNTNINVGGAKMKAPGQATQGLSSKAGLAVAKNRYVGTGGFGGGSCESEWASRLPSLEAAFAAVNGSMTDMVTKEYNLGAAGCLAEPVGGDLGNSCDWSYQKFARRVMTALDWDVAYSRQQCNEATRGDFNNLKDPAKEATIWPCELRHNFSGDHHDVQQYIDAQQWERLRRVCEIERAQKQVDAYLQANKALADKIPVVNGGLGESSGDVWSIGDRDTFAATLQYGMGWKMNGAGNQTTNDGAWCKPVGSSNLGATAAFWFFGDEMKVFEGSSVQETKESGAFYSASARYRDMSALPDLSMKPVFTAVNNRQMTTPKVDLPMKAAFLGEARADFWFTVGIFPVHIFFGANALTGVDMEEIGTATASNSCADKNKPIEQVTLGFSSGARVEPWARAEAFADASVDVGVAAAGVHMDLLLLRLGIPTGATVKADTGGGVVMDTGSDLSVDALSGRVSAYVRISAPPVFETFEATLFAWDGIHDSVQLWGSSLTAPLKLATWKVNNKVTNTDVVCINQYNNNPANKQAIPNDRNICLKNPVEASGGNGPKCSFYPVEDPNDLCTYIDVKFPYRLKGKP
jgi:hypothetical protein